MWKLALVIDKPTRDFCLHLQNETKEMASLFEHSLVLDLR